MWGPLVSLLPGWHSIVPVVCDGGRVSLGVVTSRRDGERPALAIRDRRDVAREIFAPWCGLHDRLLRQVSSAAAVSRGSQRKQ